MSTISVTLTEYEMAMCERVGRDRNASARAYRRDPGLGPTSQAGNVSGDVRGAQCEYACAIGLNLFWRPSVGSIASRDAGDLVQVRSTVLPHGRLIIKPGDDDNDGFVLVLQQGRDHTLLGWLLASDAKALAPLTSDYGDPAHFVSQRDLRDVHELKRWVHHFALERA